MTAAVDLPPMTFLSRDGKDLVDLPEMTFLSRDGDKDFGIPAPHVIFDVTCCKYC